MATKAYRYEDAHRWREFRQTASSRPCEYVLEGTPLSFLKRSHTPSASAWCSARSRPGARRLEGLRSVSVGSAARRFVPVGGGPDFLTRECRSSKLEAGREPETRGDRRLQSDAPRPEMTCPQCQTPNPDGAEACALCRHPLIGPERTLPLDEPDASEAPTVDTSDAPTVDASLKDWVKIRPVRKLRRLPRSCPKGSRSDVATACGSCSAWGAWAPSTGHTTWSSIATSP